MFTAIIVDDELKAIEGLRLLIERFMSDINIIATTTKPEEGISLIDDLKPQLLFLDINMPTLNGFQMLERLSYNDFHLIFTTAHEENAIKEFRKNKTDFLLKPIDIDDLEVIMNKLKGN